jgi:Phage integrase SAM-like domain
VARRDLKKTVPQGCRTNPLPNSLTPVPNYPKKLAIYQLVASPYWWVRYFADGKILRRSTKETDKRKAFEFAKRFYDEINFKRSTGQALTPNTLSNFGVCADAMLTAQESNLQRGEISKISHQNDVLRMRKHIKPFFGTLDLRSVNYKICEDFIAKLQEEELAPATLNAYLGLVRKVLHYAQRIEVLQVIPRLPKVKKRDSPRGWFTVHEYRRLYSTARHMAGKTFILKGIEATKQKGKGTTYLVREDQRDKRGGRPIRKITISPELRNVITFMCNSFIRPTDLKHMKHKHVTVVDEPDRKTLILNLPKSKEHDQSIWTMPQAVDIYLRQSAETIPNDSEWQKLSKKKRIEKLAEQHVFLPSQKNRDKALKDLQVQFSILTTETKLRAGIHGQDRTLYSMRHTCIMYRLLYGIGIDLLTLANNARTSPEMIHRFYARHLTGGDNLEMIQSRRRRKLKETFLLQQIQDLQTVIREGSS